MTIVISILKIIGIILLSVFGLVLLLAAVILFVPVRYRIVGESQEEIFLQGKMHWLLHLVTMSAFYREKQIQVILRIAGIPKILYDSSGEDDPEDAADIDKPECADGSEDADKPEHAHVPEQMQSTGTEPYARNAQDEDKTTGDSDKNKPGTVRKIKEAITKIRELLEDEKNKILFQDLFGYLKYLVRHLRPRKLKAQAEFSCGDPEYTGIVLGGISIIPLVYQYKMQIYPDFVAEELYVRGSFQMKGHARMVHIVRVAIQGFCNKGLRRFIKKYR